MAPLRCTPSWMSGTPQGPTIKRQQAACPSGASEHRDGADATGLQLAGDGLRRAQGHEARLEHRPPATADGNRDARLRGGLEHTGIDVHHHLKDRAAESRGGHGWMARNTDPSPRRNHPDQGVAVRAVLGRGSPCPWLDRGCLAPGPGVVLIRGDCRDLGDPNAFRLRLVASSNGAGFARSPQSSAAQSTNCRPSMRSNSRRLWLKRGAAPTQRHGLLGDVPADGWPAWKEHRH